MLHQRTSLPRYDAEAIADGGDGASELAATVPFDRRQLDPIARSGGVKALALCAVSSLDQGSDSV